MAKRLIAITLLFSAFVITTKSAYAGTDSYGIPSILHPTLQGKLRSALGKIKCRISKHLGVMGDDNHPSKSCHMKRRAIDIANLKCRGALKNQSRDKKLRALIRKLPHGMMSRFLVCYKEIGKKICRPGHGYHLHFGGREYLGCKM